MKLARRRGLHVLVLAAASASASLAPASAAAAPDPPTAPTAPSKAQCIAADTDGQELRRAGKLAEARDKLRLCADPACPSMVQGDCTTRLDELDRVQPTVVFQVKDASGADVSAVAVTVDGKPLVDRLDGTALPVDPGSHVFAFSAAGAAGQPPVTRTLVLFEGEKDRREKIALGGAPGAAPATAGAATIPLGETTLAGGAAPAAGEPAPASHGLGGRKLLGLVVAGAGVAGLAAGGVFGALTLSEKSRQQSDCASATSCNSPGQAQSDHSAGMTDGLVSTVGFIAGGALLVGGAVLFFTAPAPSAASSGAAQPAASASMAITPSVGPGGGGIVWQGRF